MTREEAINLLLPELNDIGDQLAQAYKLLNTGEISWLHLKMNAIEHHTKSIIRLIESR